MTPAATIEAAAADWLARRDGPHWSQADGARLEAWLAQDTLHRVALLRLQSAWAEAGRLQALGAGLHDAAVPPRGTWTARGADAALAPASPDPVAQLQGHVFSARGPLARVRPRGGIAAVAAVAVCALALGWGWRELATVAPVHYATALGDVRSLDLADGSQATLASDSRIALRLSRSARHIALEQGEAYFEVAKDPARPFVVEAGTRRVVAVGTRFSVRRDAADLRVVVTEGLVRLEAGDAGTQADTLLPAGSVAIVHRDSVLVRSMPLDEAARLVDWRSGLLVFRDTTLADAASEFNRYNARKIVIGDARVGDLRIGGSFRWANAEGFVRLLEQGFPVRAEYRSDRIVLHSP
ncbi:MULTISPECIES: FecR family protein [unclassified Luteimonas]